MSMAIKYAMMKHGKKMAGGGMCEHGSKACKMCHGGEYAKGGDVDELREGSDDRMIRQDSEDMEHEPMPKDYESHEAEYAAENQEHPEDEEDLVARIMKGRAQHMSKGGRVANRTDDYTDEEPNQFDDLVKDDYLEQHYTGANSGDEIGNDQEDQDREDIVARIMKSRRLKDRNPRPA